MGIIFKHDKQGCLNSLSPWRLSRLLRTFSQQNSQDFLASVFLDEKISIPRSYDKEPEPLSALHIQSRQTLDVRCTGVKTTNSVLLSCRPSICLQPLTPERLGKWNFARKICALRHVINLTSVNRCHEGRRVDRPDSLTEKRRPHVVRPRPGSIRSNMFRECERSFRQSRSMCFFVLFSSCFFSRKTVRGFLPQPPSVRLRPSRRRLQYSLKAGGVQTTPETTRVAHRRCDAPASEPHSPTSAQWVRTRTVGGSRPGAGLLETHRKPEPESTFFFLVSSFISPLSSLIFRPSTPGPRRLRPSPKLTALSGSLLSNKSSSGSFAFKTKLSSIMSR